MWACMLQCNSHGDATKTMHGERGGGEGGRGPHTACDRDELMP